MIFTARVKYMNLNLGRRDNSKHSASSRKRRSLSLRFIEKLFFLRVGCIITNDTFVEIFKCTLRMLLQITFPFIFFGKNIQSLRYASMTAHRSEINFTENLAYHYCNLIITNLSSICLTTCQRLSLKRV